MLGISIPLINLGCRFGTSKKKLSPQWLRLLSVRYGGGSVVVDLLFPLLDTVYEL